MQLENSEKYKSKGSQHAGDRNNHGLRFVAPMAPLIVLLLALTAIPVRLRQFDIGSLSVSSSAFDLVANIAGYIPVGMVLARMGFRRGIGIAALLTLAAESCQFFIVHRYPSLTDVVLNVIGALVGLFITLHFRIVIPAIPVTGVTAWLSVLALIAVIGFKYRSEWDVGSNMHVNSRGATSPGALEAHWTFDEKIGRQVADSSGNGMDGWLEGGGRRNGKRGLALSLDGAKDYVDFASPVGLRLMGSMTITAWIKSKSYPKDDATIVSSHLPGYQLDTTIDTGPRTIGFKLIDPAGEVIVRYGRTVLVRNVWYHVAGVYDADKKTMTVYLNGKLDDGFLLGSAPVLQQASGTNVYVGRRSDSEEYPFKGLIDDVQIYSRALTKAEIEITMRGQTVDTAAEEPATALAQEIESKRLPAIVGGCYRPTDPVHTIHPGAMALFGMLIAVASVGFGVKGRILILLISLAAGIVVIVVPGSPVTFPWYTLLILPSCSVAGSFSVLASVI